MNCFKRIKIVTVLIISCCSFNASASFDGLNFKGDSIQYIGDSTKAFVYLKGKTGIYDFQQKKYILKPTNAAVFELDSLNCFVVANAETISIIDFNCGDTLFPYQQKTTATNSIKYLQKEKYKPYKRKLDNARFEQHDAFTGGYIWTLYQANKSWFAIEKEHEIGNHKKLTIERFNDSLLIVQNYEWEYCDPRAYPLRSILYPDEDSIFLDPVTGFYYATYPECEPGYDGSGVYNLNTKSWFIQPKFEAINVTKKGLLLTNYFGRYLEEDFDWQRHYFHISFTGDTLFYGKLASELSTTKDFVNEMVSEQEIVKIADYPAAVCNESRIWNKYELLYLLNSNGNWSIIDFSDEEYYINPIASTQPKEWVHYDRVYEQYYWLENDSICTQYNWKIYKVSQKEGQLLVQVNRGKKAQRKITLIEGTDTTVFNQNYIESETEKNAYVHIVVKEDLLLINQWDQTPRIPDDDKFDIKQGFIDKYRSYKLIEYENEASTVWHKSNGIWERQLPYFAEVTQVPFGFLVRTGDFFEFTDPKNGTFNHKKSRYLLYNNSFEPISYMDFYDFEDAVIYPFGVALLTETGYFLVNNKAKPVTSAIWDEFVLENGKVRAGKFFPENWDEYHLPQIYGKYEKVEIFELE